MTSATDAAPAKPLPVIDDASRPFFEGALQGKLMLRRCRACGTFMWPVGGIRTPLRPRCVECFSGDLEWAPSRGKGSLYSFAVMHQVYHPAFAAEIPYNISVIELEEGVRMTCAVVDCPNEELQIGMPVEVIFERVTEGIALPKFKRSS
jgi:uncharacterized OB-fold protein